MNQPAPGTYDIDFSSDCETLLESARAQRPNLNFVGYTPIVNLASPVRLLAVVDEKGDMTVVSDKGDKIKVLRRSDPEDEEHSLTVYFSPVFNDKNVLAFPNNKWSGVGRFSYDIIKHRLRERSA